MHDRNTYDELPYETTAIPAANPVRLSLVSAIHGGPRPRVEGFRLLELGCGNGGNLLPLAFYHPNAELFGVDSSAGAIARAREGAAELGLRNVEFEPMDLSHPGRLLEERFDYVVVHGVFSWVQPEVRAGILEACERCPADDGLVYLSYNVRAGWQVRTLVREMLLEEVGSVEPLRERVRRAKETASRLREVLGDVEHAQQVQLAWELERVARAHDSYLFHEYLLEVNRPFHHREVVAMLRERGLAFLCDSSFNEAAGREPERLGEALNRLEATGERREALLDFLGCRAFRSSVFCRAGARDDGAKARLLAGLGATFVAAELRPEKGPPDLASDAAEAFLHPKGWTVTASGAVLKAALSALGEAAPRYLPVDELRERARVATGRAALDDETVRVFHRDLLAMYEVGVLDLQLLRPRGIGEGATGRPHALARLEVRRGPYLSTPLHTSLTLASEARAIVRLLAAGRAADEVVDAAREQSERALLGHWGLLEG